MEAFAMLNQSRGERGIPLSEIQSYCDLYDVTDRQFFTEVMLAADRALRGHTAG